MEPISIIHNSKKGFQVVHRCKKCGFERNNMINEDIKQPDSIKAITEIMKKNTR